jgi:hypothetical protein
VVDAGDALCLHNLRESLRVPGIKGPESVRRLRWFTNISQDHVGVPVLTAEFFGEFRPELSEPAGNENPSVHAPPFNCFDNKRSVHYNEQDV